MCCQQKGVQLARLMLKSKRIHSKRLKLQCSDDDDDSKLTILFCIRITLKGALQICFHKSFAKLNKKRKCWLIWIMNASLQLFFFDYVLVSWAIRQRKAAVSRFICLNSRNSLSTTTTARLTDLFVFGSNIRSAKGCHGGCLACLAKLSCRMLSCVMLLFTFFFRFDVFLGHFSLNGL